MNLYVPHHQVTTTSSHQYLEALKKHVTVHIDISTSVFNLGYKNIGMSISLLSMKWIGYLVLENSLIISVLIMLDHLL